MEEDRKEEVPANIPHMHLFMYLKHRFPGLKDADITDSIQRFGLDKVRCENELNQRSQEQHRGYYSPWSRSTSNSRGSPSSRNSPLSPDIHSFTPSPLQNGSSPSALLLPGQCLTDSDKENSEQLLELSLSNSSVQIGETKIAYPYASQLIDPSEHNIRKHSSPQLANSGFGRTYNGYKNIKEESSSAPIISETQEPFFDNLLPSRRSSADAVGQKTSDSQRGYSETPDERPDHLYNLGNTFYLPSSSVHTAMTPPSNSSPAVTAANFNTSPESEQRNLRQQQQFPAAIQEQLARKEKLKEELVLRIGEKSKLEVEVKHLSEEIETREKNQKLDVVRSKKEIELIQQENSQLQCICDEMEREILESGESPKTDQEGRLQGPRFPPSPNDVTCPGTPLDSPLRAVPHQPLPRANSASSLSSGGVTPTTPLMPSRKAPSPPATTPMSPPSAAQATQRPTTIGSDESRKEWSCSKCTFINSPYLNECEICGFPHFPIGTPPLPPQNQNSSVPNPGGPCYCHHRRHYNLNHEHRNTVRDI